MASPLLQLTDITKSFGAIRALAGVSFELHPGEVHALLGENGAGKSTLIKVVTGAYHPDGGTIAVAGQPVRALTPATAHKLGIACVYQQPALFADLTVAENIGLRLEPLSPTRRIRWSERRIRATQLLEQIGSNISPDAEIRALSMPEQQLVEIACALGAGARIVIMDEPTASLTRKEQDLLFRIIDTLRSRGTGIIYISHRLEEIFALADRVTVLRDGRSVGSRTLRSTSPEPVPPLSESELIRWMIGRETPPRATHAHEPISRTPTNSEARLILRDVGCSASGVNHVDLTLGPGEILGLSGLVGAGRTELARVLFGITPADSGEIVVEGRRVTIRSPQDAVDLGIAYVPEDRLRHGVVLEMSVAENISMALHRRLFPKFFLRPGAEHRLATDFIRRLDVRTSGPDAPVRALSGGNQQKVALSRWLATQPRILILDEPTQGIDIGAKEEIHRIMRRLANDGIAVLMISSDLPEILAVADRIAVMRAGTITAVLPGGSDPHTVMAAALGQPTAAS